MSLNQINHIAGNTLSQAAGALVLGGFVDHLFTEPEVITNSNVFKVSIEAAAQLIVNGVIWTSFSTWAIRRGWMTEADPTRYMTLIMAWGVSQPKLLTKLLTLGYYYRSWLEQMVTGLGSNISQLPAMTPENNVTLERTLNNQSSDMAILGKQGECTSCSVQAPLTIS